MNPSQTQASIARAIRRSRKARAAVRSRRRRVALLLALIATSLGGAGIWSIGAVTGNDMVEAAVTKAKTLAELLGERSPGRRIVEQLNKSGRARALAKARPAPGQPRGRNDDQAPKIAMTDFGRLLGPPPADLVVAEAPPVLPMNLSPPSIGEIVIPPPAGGTPGGSTPPIISSQPRIVVPVPSAVPEPGTWAMMLLGFALVGLKARRRASRGAWLGPDQPVSC